MRVVLGRLWAEHGLKAFRYCWVSAVNVVVGTSVLVVCHASLGLSALWANLWAWLVGTFPAYLMSRYWVWQQRGPHRLGGEVLVFWVMAFVGLVLSTIALGLVDRYTQRTVYVTTAFIGVYGVQWVAKYLFLDKMMWRRRAGSSSDRAPGA